MGEERELELMLLQGEGCTSHPALPVPLTIQVPLKRLPQALALTLMEPFTREEGPCACHCTFSSCR